MAPRAAFSLVGGGGREPGAAAPLEKKRDWFAFFQGSLQWFDKDPDYSNGLRQKLFDLYKDDSLFHILPHKANSPEEYEGHYRRSVFSICPRGFAVWSPRIYESLLHGAIPVIIADGIVMPFSQLLDWRDFAIFISEKDARTPGKLREILLNIGADSVLNKQQNIRKVRSLFLFANENDEGNAKPLPPADSYLQSPIDAFDMILHSLRQKVVGRFAAPQTSDQLYHI